MQEDPLTRAKTYPYPIPSTSFIFDNGETTAIEADERLTGLADRTPVLAVGSNQSPVQLSRKFSGRDWGPIPVVRIALHNYDSVYSPHVASYGSIAATLQEVAGVRVSLFVTWLDEVQLTRMHETEVSGANYSYGLLSDLHIEVEAGPPVEAVHIYKSTRGTLCDDHGPIPLLEVRAEGRSRRAMSQLEVQEHIRDVLNPGMETDDFIRTSINDADLRQVRSDQLRVNAQPFAPKSFREIPI